MHTLLPKLADLQQKTIEERFGKAIGDISRAWNDKLDQRLKPLGLSQSKWRALLYVSRVPAGINQTDLARMLAIEAPTLTRLVKLLEEEGWVTRRPLPGDARCKMVRLTAKARKTVALIEGEVIRLRAETVGRLTPDQLAAGFDAMQALQRHLDEI
jgi:MarR family transcriptional regulator for hemolysin